MTRAAKGVALGLLAAPALAAGRALESPASGLQIAHGGRQLQSTANLCCLQTRGGGFSFKADQVVNSNITMDPNPRQPNGIYLPAGHAVTIDVHGFQEGDYLMGVTTNGMTIGAIDFGSSEQLGFPAFPNGNLLVNFRDFSRPSNWDWSDHISPAFNYEDGQSYCTILDLTKPTAGSVAGNTCNANSSGASGPGAAAIAGGVVGGIGGLALIAGGAYGIKSYRDKRRAQQAEQNAQPSAPMPNFAGNPPGGNFEMRPLPREQAQAEVEAQGFHFPRPQPTAAVQEFEFTT